MAVAACQEALVDFKYGRKGGGEERDAKTEGGGGTLK